MKKNIIGFVILILLTPILFVSIRNMPNASAEEYLQLGELVTLKAGYLIATSEEMFKKATDIMVAKDNEALQQLVSDGSVVITKGGEAVYYEGTADDNWGIAKVRPKGSVTTYYTAIEAINH